MNDLVEDADGDASYPPTFNTKSTRIHTCAHTRKYRLTHGYIHAHIHCMCVLCVRDMYI